jgi:hypothetical protein
MINELSCSKQGLNDLKTLESDFASGLIQRCVIYAQVYCHKTNVPAECQCPADGDEQFATSRSTSADRTSFYCLDRGVAKEVIPTADDKCWLPFKASAIVPLSKKGVGPRYES